MKDARFLKSFVWINGCIPAALLVWDALAGRLGANPGNFALLTTGILAIFFLTLTLTVTPLRKVTGWNWLIFSRRTFGLLAFFHACAHVTLYVLNKHAGNITAAFDEIIQTNYLLIGSIGVLAMVPLALTSTGGMIRRLGARRWQMLHRLVYVAALAGAVHFCLQGKIVRPLAWLYLGIISALLAFRIIWFLATYRTRPAAGLVPSRAQRWSGQLRIVSIALEARNVRTFRLAPAGDSPFPFSHLPGQYLTLGLSIDGQKVYRCYTIASAPGGGHDGYCELTTKREDNGRASRYMHDNLAVGGLLSVTAPSGNFTFTGEESSRIALLAGGVGITPLMSILRDLTGRSWTGQIYLIYSNRTESDIIFRTEFEDLARRFSNFHLTLALTRDASPAWTGHRGRIDAALLARTIPDLEEVPFYICGPADMLRATRATLLQLQVPPANIHMESFGTRPEAPPADLSPDSSAFTVTFARTGKSAAIPAGQPILELAESLAIPVNYECRSGICGTCKCALLSGSVTMATQDALTPSDRAANLILLCQSLPTADVTVEA